MKSNLSFYIGIRYALSKRKEGFLSFISGFSFCAMALGVMTLIIVLSVMNGFDQEIKQRLLNVIPHVIIKQEKGLSRQDIDQLSARLLASDSSIQSIMPFVEDFAMLGHQSRQQAVSLKGIDSGWSSANPIAKHMLIGSVSNLQAGEFGILLGSQVARKLNVSMGESIEVILPTLSVTPLGAFPRLKMMKVMGVFEVGAQVDAATAYIHEQDARLLLQLGDNYQGIQLRLINPLIAGDVIASIDVDIIKGYQLELWSDQMTTLFQAMRMEKMVVGLLLSAIIAVAAFNIVACLILMVSDKRKDIAVLRTLGARSDQIVKLFIIQGSAVGMVGVVLGLILGCLISLFIGDILFFFEMLTGNHVFDPAIYMISALPSKLLLKDVLIIVVGASLISILATIYPAWRAGQVLPAEALRYDQ